MSYSNVILTTIFIKYYYLHFHHLQPHHHLHHYHHHCHFHFHFHLHLSVFFELYVITTIFYIPSIPLSKLNSLINMIFWAVTLSITCLQWQSIFYYLSKQDHTYYIVIPLQEFMLLLYYDHYCNFHKYLFNMLCNYVILYVLQIAEENKFKSNQINSSFPGLAFMTRIAKKK